MLKLKLYYLKYTHLISYYFLALRGSKLFSKFLDKNTPFIPRPESPTIIIGMHRSGTSLVTSLLEELGLSMGKEQGYITREDLFFLRRNELLLKITNSTWDNPSAFSDALDIHHLKNTFCQVIAHDLETFNFLPFTPANFKQINKQAWGFKDPRSSITLPVWLEIFPNAKVINVIREGNAVASSLLQRGKISLKRKKIPSLVSMQPVLSIDLWAEYVMTAHKNCSVLPDNKYLEIRYETLLKSPEKEIHQIINFLKIEVNQEIIDGAVSKVKPPNNPVEKARDISEKAQAALKFYGYND